MRLASLAGLGLLLLAVWRYVQLPACQTCGTRAGCTYQRHMELKARELASHFGRQR